MTLSNSDEHDEFRLHDSYASNTNDLVDMRSSFKLPTSRSIFTKHSYLGILSNLITISNKNKIITSQSSETVRQVHAIPEQDSYQESYIISLSHNSGFEFTVEDKCIVDMISFFLYIRDLDIIEEDLKLLARYAATIIQAYVVSQMYIKSGIRLSHLDCEIIIDKKKVDKDTLHDIFVNGVDEGEIIPISPLHYMYYFGYTDLEDWKKFILYPAISNLNQNRNLLSVAPYMTQESRTNFRNYAKDGDLLSTRSYVGMPDIPMYIGGKHRETFQDFLYEMFVRTITLDSVDLCYPLVSRGQWSTDFNESLKVGAPSLNPAMCKFTLKNYDISISRFIKSLNSIDRKLYHVKRKARLSTLCPNISHLIIPEMTTISTKEYRHDSSKFLRR